MIKTLLILLLSLTSPVHAGVNFGMGTFSIPDFKSPLEAQMFALKWHKHPKLVEKLTEKRKSLLGVGIPIIKEESMAELMERKAKTKIADNILWALRTLERDDFKELLKQYASSPVGAQVYSYSIPIKEVP